jgi:hypothetical protein
MLVDRTLVASDVPYIKVLASGLDMPPIVARAWAEMTLAQPHGAEKVHEMLERCVHNANAQGDKALAASCRDALGTFDATLHVGAPSADSVPRMETRH